MSDYMITNAAVHFNFFFLCLLSKVWKLLLLLKFSGPSYWFPASSRVNIVWIAEHTICFFFQTMISCSQFPPLRRL